ncbi:hypothetical protein E4T56_gene3938 [Termitomyces sp. T112]|nr:hypothetical protein E4T56_gene3938 [Termitomyces sp. T112]
MSSDLSLQLEKCAMAQAFLDWVNHFLSVACVSLVTNPCLAVTTIIKIWLCWFEIAGSGMEWAELVVVDKEYQQLYKQYKGEDWMKEFDKHSAPLLPSLEFLMEDLEAEMTCVTGGIAKGLAMLPRVATTPKGKSKGKGKAREEEEKEFEEPIKDSFTNKHLANLLCWQKALMVVNTGMGAGVVLKRAKGKLTVLPEEKQAFKECQGASNFMDFFKGALSKDAPELNSGGMDVAAATDNEGPSSVGAALAEGATDEGSSVVAHEALTTSTS